VIIVSNSRILQHPYILRYLKFPKLLISQEPLRIAYERNFIENYVYKKYYKGVAMRIISLYSKLGILLKEKPDRENLRNVDRLIVNSYFSKENFLANYGVLGKVVYLGVDTRIFKPASKNERENCILSVGTYHAIKDHDLVIKALSFVPENKRPLLKILGFGSFGTSEKVFQYLNWLRDSLGLKEKVKFEKNFFGNSIAEYYQKAYLTVAASFLEPFGFVPVESMACGTPVVAIKEGGFREAVKHGETGLLVERDPQELAKAILYLIENKEVWKKFSENGINWVKSNFSWERTINEIEKELLDLAKNKRDM
jgi:glycosyltransferase involved in cell wall biosynthesis